MPDPCLQDTDEIALSLTGSPGALTVHVRPSAVAGNGLEVLAGDGAYAPGYDDLLASGFPAIPGTPPADLLAKVAGDVNVSWTFRYNPLSTAGNKWEFIGGAPFYTDVETLGTISSGAASGTYSTWVDLHATDVRGPDFAVPFTGVYLIEFGACINSAASEEAQGGIATVASGTPGNDNTCTAAGTPGANFQSVMRAQQMSLTAGDTLRMFYRCTGTQVASFHRRWLKATPIHIGGSRAGGTYGGT